MVLQDRCLQQSTPVVVKQLELFCFHTHNEMAKHYSQTSVLFFITGGILIGYLCLLHLSRTPSVRTGSRPPSCFHLNNRLYMLAFFQFPPLNLHLLLLYHCCSSTTLKLYFTKIAQNEQSIPYGA